MISRNTKFGMNSIYILAKLVPLALLIALISACDTSTKTEQSESNKLTAPLSNNSDAATKQPSNNLLPSSSMSSNSLSSQAATENETESQALTILRHPESISALESDNVMLSASISGGTTDASYQWQKDGINLDGATQTILHINNAKISDSGSYRLAITSNSQLILTLEAYVSIEENIASAPTLAQLETTPVSILEQPMSVSVNEEETIQLSVSSQGTPPFSYQWQKGGSIIPGANTSSLTIHSSSLNDRGSYRVRISNDSSEIYSNFVDVWVSEKLDPPSIQSQPQTLIVNERHSATFEVSAEGSGFLTYQWRKNGSPITGANGQEFTIESTQLSDAGNYDIIVSNSQGSVASSVALLDVIELTIPVSITQHPVTQTLDEGGNLLLDVLAEGSGPISYQWLFEGEAIEGQNSSSLAIPNAAQENTGSYSVRVSNSAGEVHSNDAFVTVNRLPVSIQFSWNSPSQREDGSLLEENEIYAHIIEYGNNSTSLDQSRTIVNNGSYLFTIHDVPPGKLYARIAAIDIDGVQSHFSSVIAIDIP
jgi:hypothetical protein